MTATPKPPSEFFVGHHGNNPHESMMLSTALTTHISTVMSSLLVSPPPSITCNSHDLSNLGVDDDSTSSTANAVLLSLLGCSPGNLQEVGNSGCVKFCMDSTQLIKGWSVLQQLCSRVELCWPVSFSPHCSLLRAHGRVAWDDRIETSGKTFNFDVSSEDLADLIPRQNGRTWHKQKDSVYAIAVIVASPG